MLSSNVKALISEVVELYSTTPLTQSLIDDGVNKLIKAKELLSIEEGEETQKKEYIHWIFNPLYPSYLIENAFINAINGVQCAINKYKCTDFLEIPEGTKEIILILALNETFSVNIGAFYDANKKFVDGISSLEGKTKYYFKNGENYLTCSIDENIKYIRLSSGSSGDIQGAYCLTNKKPTEKVFEHYSNNNYTVNTVADMKKMDLSIGDTITTLGYNYVGDAGNSTYTIINYDEWHYLLPDDVKHILSNNSYSKTPVDEFGNHTLNNGLVAKLKLTGETTPEQWGAKGDGISNDCQAFTHMFAQIKTGKIIFKENATYSLGMIYKGDTITSFKDNPYKGYMCGNLLGGQLYGKPIMANIKDVEFVGNNAKIELLNDQFGSSGMGLFNFAGRIDGLKIHDLNFDGKGRKLYYTTGNKNTNHTLFYAPSTFTSNSILLKSIHPLYLEKEEKFDSGYFKNVEINNCYFYDAGAMYRQAGDWGGDFILVVNPTAMDNVNIHHNRFEAWGRWVFAVDLGGNGECMTNVKFNDNVCIGANACKYSEENYSIIKDENNKTEYILQTPDRFKNNPSMEDFWRWRALGFIDFEAKKHWKNLECQRNTIVGTAGWAINGGSGVSEEVLIKDNLWYHQGGGYPYLIEHYSGYAKNWAVENNIMPSQRQAKLGLTVENADIKNNKGWTTFRTFGMLGDITFDNNKLIEDIKNTNYKLFSLENANVPEYLYSETELVGTLTFINNDGFISAGENIDKLPNFKLDIHDNVFNSLDIKDFHHRELGVNEFSYCTNDANLTYFGMHLTQELSNPRKCGAYYKEGEVISTSIKAIGVPKNYFFQHFIPNEDELAVISKYNYNYSSLLNQGVNGIKYSDYKIVCTKEGIIPAMGMWGFGNQMNYFDIMFTENRTGKIGAGVYIYTKDNLYKSVSTETKTLDKNNPPTHTKGVALCGDCELQWVDKIGMAKLIGIE